MPFNFEAIHGLDHVEEEKETNQYSPEVTRDIALSDYWTAHPERKIGGGDESIITRAHMRQRVKQAFGYAFDAGRKYGRRERE